jgi:serine/threonine-protein kinase
MPKAGVFTASAAEDTVQAFYTMTSEGDYEDSAKLLSADWRRSTFPNQAVFEGTFDKVESVKFVVGPDATVSGNEATVTGETQAALKRRTDRNTGTWYLVRENGRWKIDGWDVSKLSSRPS